MSGLYKYPLKSDLNRQYRHEHPERVASWNRHRNIKNRWRILAAQERKISENIAFLLENDPELNYFVNAPGSVFVQEVRAILEGRENNANG